MNKNLSVATALLCIAMLSACAMDYPKTRDEVIHHPDIEKRILTVPRRLDDVVASLNKQARACVNHEFIQTSSGMSTSHSVQIMTIRKVSAKKAELDYRQKSNNVPGQPEGGLFLFVADLEAQGPKSTKLIFYHSYFQETLMNALAEWAKGNDKSCHGYGGD